MESDFSNAVQAINSSGGISYEDLIASDISKILCEGNNGSCRFVSRDANDVVHILSKSSLSFGHDMYW